MYQPLNNSKQQETLIIADLHLEASAPHIIADFIIFLQNRAVQSEALYILGDLFEAWVGDDDEQSAYKPVKTALATLTKQGTALYLQHGNRDFLLGNDFCQQVGATLLADQYLVDLYGTPCLLMHGDTLCSDDIAYLELRNQVHSSAWQQQFLSLTLAQRYQAAKDLRAKSKAATHIKTANIMDVNQVTVIEMMQKHQVKHLIHGHTHRPACHQFDLEQTQAQRWVVGDWQSQYNYLSCRPQNWQWITF